MAAFLVPIESGAPIPLEKAILLIGRGPECDVSITHSRKVSRRHCCLAQVNDYFVVRDLGSTNGVAVNGEKVRREAVLNVGDELIVGDVRFRLSPEPNLPRQKPAASSSGSTLRGSTHHEKKPFVRPAPPPAVSQELPVALPEPEDESPDFEVEMTGRHTPPAEPSAKLRRPVRPESDVIPLQSDSDVIVG